MGLSILVGITPSQKIKGNIIKLRQEIPKLTEESTYKESEPHITIFVNTFSSFPKIESEFKKLLQRHRPFAISSEGVHSFGYDPITRFYTLVYKIKNSPELAQLQRDLFSALCPKRTDRQKRLLQKKSKPSKKQLENLEKYGYFFGPDDWTFHATIGSIPKEYSDKLEKLAKKFEIKESWKVNEINIYLKRRGDNHHKFYKSYKL